ncbi:two-component hybrid sensor and regulator [Desulfocucumis palustris]|uniref:Circadian input-output histidine kinase CikA n=1 Tax=Desulfocucumis palustris TaxID=1898651 RepID=A0A2L2XA96_9FIRM|nr:[Fe-Fe] hydrogenase large subunit C-terminal domain-containing protein [Desulfocucumis palustris]GBF33088.1 two-component hybrid sensor and regulator [Desulfocucumis palustris]
MLNGIVYTDKEKCEACSACLRVCRTKSIMIKDGKSEIIKESCLNCGACITVCSKGAKKYRNSIEKVEQILENKKAALILAPSYVIVAVKKYNCTPEQFCTALRELGFKLVYESSFGADVVTKVYIDYINDQINKRGREKTNVITSPCPSLMNYVEKHTPELLDNFAPILSPMAAQAVIVRHWNGEETAIVGASPCMAKKSELLDEELGLYAEKMTFEELIELIDSRGIIPANLEESEFDGVQPFYGAGFPISGGLTKTMEQYGAGAGFDLIGNNYLLVEGEDRSINFLKGMARKINKDGTLTGYPLLVDILYCEGCILGKALGVRSDFWENRRIISEYTRKRFKKAVQGDLVREYKGYSVLVKNTAQAPEFEKWLEIVEQLIKDNKFTRTWNNVHYHKKEPTEKELKFILEYDGKYSEKDELNCGACGYETCRERAVAVFNGENELGGCIVHIKFEAKTSLEENKRLQELDQMKSDFLSTVSHELRTPLTSVLGFSKIIKKRLEEVVFPEIKTDDKKVNRAVRQINDNVDIIISESQRLTTLINDVLDLSKMEAGKIEWKMEPLFLEEVIDRATSATTSLFEQKGLELIKDVEEGLPQILGDGDRLIQTVINLISNAVKFTDSGTVTCRAKRVDGEVVVGIIDTGIGIAGDDLEKVFEKFKQVGDTLTDKPKGTGLGLPICKQIVEQHGGRIWVESEPGKGSTFSFAIPLQSGEKNIIEKINVDSLVKQMKKQVAAAVEERTEGRKTILVVDDDNNIRNLLRQELEVAGYSVIEAADGVEAINLIKKDIPDLILLDVMMPRMSGFDVAAVLKNDPVTMNIPIVIVSIIENRERGYSIGVDRYFTKPLNTEELLKEIGLLLSQGVSKKKVLVVDEDKSTLKTLVDVLQARGYTVVKASDTEECISKAVEEKPDMIILNTLLSERHEVVKTLRLEKGLENVLFLFTGKIIENQCDG